MSYSRPSVKDREIFSSEGLVPFGEFWRTGANSPTSIVISDDIKIAGEVLSAGEYILLSKPNEREWEYIVL